MPFINGIGPMELIIVLVIALIVVGPGRLPDVGSALGKSIREFRKAASDVKDVANVDAPAPQPAPAPAAPVPAPLPAATGAIPAVAETAPVAAQPAPAQSVAVAEPAPAVAEDPAAVTAPDISEMPEPAPAADEQRTPTA